MVSRKLILSVILLFSIPLACTIPTFGMKNEPTPAPVEEQAAPEPTIDLSQMFSTDPNTGAVVITITEQMLGSMLNKQMAQDPSAMLSEPLVTLRNGHINIDGKTNQAGITLETQIIVTPTVGADGLPAITIDTVKIGPLEAPEAVRTAVSGIAQKLFTNAIGNGLSDQKLQSITINDGVMVVVMQPNQ